MKIGIIGSGYVGLVTGACFAHLGNTVICIDKDKRKVDMLKKGKVPIYEPGLSEMITQNVKEKRLSFSTSIAQAVSKAEILFICVNTPEKPNGEADLSYVENVSQSIAQHMNGYKIIVEKSTVPVQTGEWVSKTIKNNRKSRASYDVASNPEFLREGSAIQDFLKPDRVVLGVSSQKAAKVLRQLYEPLKAPIVVTDIKSAELIKHASNSFLATKISFINCVSRVCDAVGADVEQVAKGMGLDPRIGPSFLKAGIGFGGHCFPKDLAAFAHMSEKLGSNFDMLHEVLKVNEDQKLYFVRKVEEKLWNLKNKTLGVLGLAFKADTDDLRYAPSVTIIEELQKEGVKIRAYDPQAAEKSKALLKNITYAKTPYDAVKGADAILVLTEWREFMNLDFKRIKKLVKHPIIFDGRNIFDPARMSRLGFKYYGMGKNIKKSR